MRTFLSLVIPVYNVENYLHQCLDSIFSQTFKDFEVICVDDGSTDNSLKILRNYAKNDKRLSIICQSNLGAGVARNRGMEKAKGQYIVFLDSDDFFELTFFEKMIGQAINTNADIVICNRFQYDNKTKKTELCFFPFSTSSMKNVFSIEDIPCHIFNWFRSETWNKLFRLDFIRNEALCFQPLRSANDLFFIFSMLAKAKRISLVDENLVYWRTNRENSLTFNRTKKYSDDFFYAWKALKEFLEKESLFEKLRQSYVNAASASILWECNIPPLPIQIHYHEILRSQWLQELELTGYEKSFYYDEGNYNSLIKIRENTYYKYDLFRYFKYKLLHKITFGKKKKKYKEKYELIESVNDYFSHH